MAASEPYGINIMLRITPCVSSEAAKRYFRDALSKGDYFLNPGLLKDQEVVGRWGGRAAELLGLSGPVTAEAFERLCDNLHPVTGDKLTPRTKDDRRVLYDFTFSVPKSVSVALELLADRRIQEAFREAVRETLIDMEQSMKTRVRRKGENTDRPTANMVWGDFTHFTARPVDGVPDPHLHIHATVFNCTWDETERRWKAGEFGDIKRDAPYHQTACDVRLANKLVALGYGVERRGDGWELVGVPASVVRKFSRRTEQIERLAEELGITDPTQKAGLGATSRGRKQQSFTMEQLRDLWSKQLTETERAALHSVGINAALHLNPKPDLERSAERAMDFALQHAFERSSVVSEKRLLEAALVWGVGRVTVAGVAGQLATRVASKDVLLSTVEGERLATTRAVLDEERRVLDKVRAGRGQHAPLKAEHRIEDGELSAEQRAAVRHVLESTDSVILIRGRAGVGKTRMMQEVVKAVEATGKTVQAAAPTAMATHEVLRGDGFLRAETVASLVANRESPMKLKGQVIWVDETGLMSMSEMAKLIRLADEAGARLILSGDTRQHRSVVRGDAMRLLESETGLVPAELKQVRRQQRADYRKAAEALSRGDLVDGFGKLDKMGAIREAGAAERPGLVADIYIEAIRAGQSALIVAPTHLEGGEVTKAIRERLKAEKMISTEEHTFTRLHNRHLTEAQQGDPASFREKDVIQFHQNAPGGFRPGDTARVVALGKDGQSVTVHRSRDEAVACLPLQAAKAFQVFEPQDLKLAVGDRIRITYNGRTSGGASGGQKRLSNGALYTIKSIDEKGGLTLDIGWRVPKGFGHIAHGYAVTSDASQGRTVDHVIVAQSDWSSAASNIQQFYTSITRGKHAVTVVTDDKDRLLKSIAKDNSRMSATELMKAASTPPRQRGLGERLKAGLWMAKENTRRMKEAVNRHLHRDRQERQRSEHERNRRRSRDEGVSRER
jgi:conjugative relaxase-like TrwC/TraI family protein